MLIIIDNYDSFTYNLYQGVAGKMDTRVFRNDKITLRDIEAMNPSGIILSPGPGRPEDAGICIKTIQTFSHKIPILGICLGHQAIGSAFGGRVIQNDEIVHGKTGIIHHIPDALFANIPNTFRAGRYHSLVVDMASLPADLLITAIGKEGAIMGLKHAAYPCYGVQFHPESILTEYGDRLLNNFITLCQTLKEKNDVTDGIHQQANAA